MKIIIVGCGKIGTAVLGDLVSEGHDVVAVDKDNEVLKHLTDIYDVMSVCGNGADCDLLEEAGVASSELFLALTGSDELNMIACFLAKKMGASRTVARIRNPEYNDSNLDFMRRQLDIDISINPELLTAQELFNILQMPAALKIESFSRRHLKMIEVRINQDSKLAGLSLMRMREKYKANYLIGAVQRGNNVYIPGGDFVLQAGDKIGITATSGEFEKFLKALGISRKQARNVMIIGGSKTAFYLAQHLEKTGTKVRIIEQNHERCEELADGLSPKTMVINGDGAQQETLLQNGLRLTDAFVSLTGIDEENILISVFAATQNIPTVIAKVSRDELSSLAEKIGLDCVVSPKHIASDIIVRYARALDNAYGSNIETLYKLMDGSAEAIEFVVKHDSDVVDIPLKSLNIKKNILIAGIMRGREVIIPSGNDTIQPGDHVVVLAAGQKLYDLSDIIR